MIMFALFYFYCTNEVKRNFEKLCKREIDSFNSIELFGCYFFSIDEIEKLVSIMNSCDGADKNPIAIPAINTDLWVLFFFLVIHIFEAKWVLRTE